MSTETTDGSVDFVDEHSVTDDYRGKVTKYTSPNDTEGFAVNLLPAGHPPGFVEAVTGHFDARYNASGFDDGIVVGVVFAPIDDVSTVFPIGVSDRVKYCRPDDDAHKGGRVAGIEPDDGGFRLYLDDGTVVQAGFVVEVTDREGVGA